jgi:hypothetical protein
MLGIIKPAGIFLDSPIGLIKDVRTFQAWELHPARSITHRLIKCHQDQYAALRGRGYPKTRIRR